MGEIQPSVTQRILASTCGAMLTALAGISCVLNLVTPLDVIKVRLQMSSHHTSCMKPTFSSSSLQFIPRSFSIPYTSFQYTTCNSLYCSTARNPFTVFIQILKNEGPASLWRGLLPAMIMSIPSSTVYLLGFEHIKTKFLNLLQFHGLSHDLFYSLTILASGALSRIFSVAVVSPIELFRTKTQSISSSNLSALKQTFIGLSLEVRDKGISTLWRGFIPTLWRDVPFSAIYWLSYENLKPTISSTTFPTSEIKSSFTSGLLSGALAAFLTTPFDVAKTRRQVLDRSSARLFSLIKEIYLMEGVAGLFKGLTPRVTKVAPACAIMITTYEVGKRL